jgi:gamma-glutamyl:cysteine ligase YbdK (ATP-grasp superfamily)
MPPPRHTLGLRRQLDRDIKRADTELNRLRAARAALDGEVVLPREKPRRISQDDVAADLAAHPDSTYTEAAGRLGVSPVTVAQHYSRGQKAGRFLNASGKWRLAE